jgi:urocanate hydratase
LQVTDELAAEILEDIVRRGLPDSVAVQYEDNIRWIREAGKNRLVVGSQARILYADQRARVAMAMAFNQAIRGNSCAPFNPPEALYLLCRSSFSEIVSPEGKISDCVVLSRDHHDVSGTDSPFRETSNIYDGSAFTAGRNSASRS